MPNIIEELLVPETNKGLFYGGAFHAASQPGEIVVMNPAKGIRFTTVPEATPQDVTAAVSAARGAFAGWSGLDAFDRSKHLRAFAEVVRDNIPLLAVLESTVTGRSLREMNAQMGRIPEWLEYFAGIALGLEGESNVVKGGYVTLTQYEPLGPVALLTPWNHPVLILMKKLAAALAVGILALLNLRNLHPYRRLRSPCWPNRPDCRTGW